MNPGPDAAQWFANDIAVAAAVVSLGGVVVNAVIAYFAVTQSKAAQASAEAARDSVAAARQSAEQAKDALELSNRAWVHVDRIDPHMSNAAEASQNRQIILRPDVVLRNYGSTPAAAFIAGGHLQVFSDLPTTADLALNITDENGVSVVSPGNEFWVPSAFIALTFDEWRLITSGERKLVLFGRAHYDDIFGKQHKSTWLYWYDSEKVGGFVPGPVHNYAT
jgi:hypothetical protein